MARSLRSTPGKKQTYNLYDTSDLTRALKTLNERISEIERTWGQDSQIYRDYTAPLRTISIQQNVRVDSLGRLKFKTGKGQNTEDVRTVVTRMLAKQTKGDIIESTRVHLGAGKTVNEKGFKTYSELKQSAEEYRLIFHEIDSLIREIYNLVGNESNNIINDELQVGYILEGHWGDLSKTELETARDKMKEWVQKAKNDKKDNIFKGRSL